MSRGALHADLEERQVFFFPHFFPFFVSTWCRRRRRLPLETHFRSPLFFFFFGGCCARALLFHQPPTRVSSIIIIDRRRGEREREKEEGACSPRYRVALPPALLFQPSSDRFLRCVEVPFVNISNWARPSAFVMYGSAEVTAGVMRCCCSWVSSLLFSPCLCGISRGCCAHYLYIQTRSASSLNRREPNGHEK